MKGGRGWGGAGGESGVALRPPTDAPSAPTPHPSSFPSFCAQHGSSLFGAGGWGDWQAISDVMPAVQ